MIIINFKNHLVIIKKWDPWRQKCGGFAGAVSRAIQDSRTPSDRARQDALSLVMSHEIRRREGPQRCP